MNQDASSFLWNSSCHEALAGAQLTGAKVHLECCLIWRGESTCMSLEGQVQEVNGREARLMVSAMIIRPPNPKEEAGQGKFYFSAKRQIAHDMTARLGIYGTAHILETIAGPEDDVASLRLRFSRHITARFLRSGKRIPWRAEYSRMSCVLLVQGRPETSCELRAILNEYIQKAPPASRIIDISEGGACICMPEELAIASHTSDATYLFFLQPSVEPASTPPYVFVAKRASFGKASDAEGVVVRLRFQNELDWTARRTRLCWLNVKGGSPRLRQCLMKYANMPQEQQDPS